MQVSSIKSIEKRQLWNTFEISPNTSSLIILLTSLKQVFPVEQQTGSFRQPKQEQGISILFRSTHAPPLVLVSPPSFFCGLCSGTWFMRTHFVSYC